MIAAHGLSKWFARTPVLADVTLEVGAGQCVVLLGPNGAGKTTLLRIVATLARPSRGSLTVCGLDALKEPQAVRPMVGVVAHGSYVYEELTALENLRFWTVMADADASRARLLGALQRVELEMVATERVRTFSAGMKRRLALARVLLGRAKLLLLDEPFTGLDQRGRKWLSEFVLAFKAAGGTALVATHSFASGLAIADRVVILHDGRIVADRSADELSSDTLRRLYDGLTEAEGSTG